MGFPADRRDTAVQVAAVSPATRAEWRDAFAADTCATFFHGPAWSELWEEYTRGAIRPNPVRVEFVDGRSAILGISRVPTRVPGVLRDTLSPEGNCGGWVSAAALTPEHGDALSRVILASSPCVWRLGPADRGRVTTPPDGGRRELTHLIDLRQGTDAVWDRWKPSARGSARRASRCGVRVVEGAGRRRWEAFAELYEAAVSRWSRPLDVYESRLFSLLAERVDAGVRLWLAEVDGEACAGSVVLTHRPHAIAWLGASVPGRAPGASNLLDWEVLRQLTDEGFAIYDLSGSGPLQGVVRYKESVGARREPVIAYERRHPLERVGSAVRVLGRKARLLAGKR